MTGKGIVGLQDALVLLKAGKGRRLGVEVEAVHYRRGRIHEGRSGRGDESSLVRREDSRRRRRDDSRDRRARRTRPRPDELHPREEG